MYVQMDILEHYTLLYFTVKIIVSIVMDCVLLAPIK